MSTISHIAKKDVLAIREASALLGYDRGSKTRRQSVLLNAARACRRNYHTPDGVPGTQLLTWTLPEVREQLQQMVIGYLDSGHGAELWPATGIPPPREVPEYATDRAR